jgi:hypothetical protein
MLLFLKRSNQCIEYFVFHSAAPAELAEITAKREMSDYVPDGCGGGCRFSIFLGLVIVECVFVAPLLSIH